MSELYLENPIPERNPLTGQLNRGNQIAKGNTWDRIYDEETRQRQLARVKGMLKVARGHKPTRTRKVICNGIIYNSAAEASRNLFGDANMASHIIKCCRGKRYKVKGLRFEYYYEE